MSSRFVWLVAFVVWTIVVLAPVAAPAAPAVADCSGCTGISPQPDESNAGPNNICFVRLSAVVSNGQCGNSSSGCVGQACEVLVTRSWRLPYGTKIDYCKKVGPNGTKFCEKPPLQATSNMATQTSGDQDSVACGKSKTFTLAATACGAPMQATVVATCSACQ